MHNAVVADHDQHRPDRASRRTDLSRIMRCADLALYQAKDLGRNRVVQIDEITGSIAA